MAPAYRKRLPALLLVFLMIMEMAGLTGCSAEKEKTKKDLYFGTRLSDWNPLVIYAEDSRTQEGSEKAQRYFARDPSLISMVTGLFDEMEWVAAEDTGTPAGISFTIDTMLGRVQLGTCDGQSVWQGGKRYPLEEDCTKELERLFGLIRAENEGITAVTKEQILAVKPRMTYRELLDHFGRTLQTAVVGVENAFLYQYNGAPFYITFEKDDDMVQVDGETLLEGIGDRYNIASLLSEPQELPAGRGGAYTAALQAAKAHWNIEEPVSMDLGELPYTDENDRKNIAETAGITDTAQEPALSVSQYYHMAEDKMRFQLCWQNEGEAVYADVACTKTDSGWMAEIPSD